MPKSAIAKPKRAAQAAQKVRSDATFVARAKPALKTGESSAVNAKTYSRAKLVGKFPHIEHRPAPSAIGHLDEADRRELLQSMVLS